MGFEGQMGCRVDLGVSAFSEQSRFCLAPAVMAIVLIPRRRSHAPIQGLL